MATVRPVELAPDAAIARRSRAERSKLRRELGRLDAVCLLIAAIVVLDTLGAVAKGGAQTLTLLAVVAVCFFVPAGLVIAELGAAFPNQGGPYVWTRLAFGRYAGSLVALIYFLETPIWVGGSLAITAVAVVDRLVVPLEGVWRVPVALAFVWVTVAAAVAPLRAGKRVPLAGAAAQVGLLAFFTATVVAYAARHGVHGPAAGDLVPTWAVFAVVAPVLVYNFLGFELPSAAGEELRDPARDVPASIVRAGVLTCVLYAIPVLAIVLVVPADRLTGLTGFIDALAAVFVVYGPWEGLVGGLAALAFLWILVANGLTWVMASSRTQAAASLDGVGPASLGRVSARTGTPVTATLAGGAGRHRHHPGRLRRGRRRQQPLLQPRPDPLHLAARPGQPGRVPGPGAAAPHPPGPAPRLPGPRRRRRGHGRQRPGHRLVGGRPGRLALARPRDRRPRRPPARRLRRPAPRLHPGRARPAGRRARRPPPCSSASAAGATRVPAGQEGTP